MAKLKQTTFSPSYSACTVSRRLITDSLSGILGMAPFTRTHSEAAAAEIQENVASDQSINLNQDLSGGCAFSTSKSHALFLRLPLDQSYGKS